MTIQRTSDRGRDSHRKRKSDAAILDDRDSLLVCRECGHACGTTKALERNRCPNCGGTMDRDASRRAQ